MPSVRDCHVLTRLEVGLLLGGGEADRAPQDLERRLPGVRVLGEFLPCSQRNDGLAQGMLAPAVKRVRRPPAFGLVGDGEMFFGEFTE